MSRRSALDRFWSRVHPEPNTGCWLWEGASKNREGYGALQVNGRSTRAHRFAYAHFVRPIPKGLCVLHRCDVPECVNPEHLWTGTRADNNRDMTEKGRRAVGSRHADAKLVEGDVADIKLRRLAGETTSGLAREYGVSRRAITLIMAGETWKHVGPPIGDDE